MLSEDLFVPVLSETRVWFILYMEVIKLGSFRVRPRTFVIGFNLKKDTICQVTSIVMSSQLQTVFQIHSFLGFLVCY